MKYDWVPSFDMRFLRKLAGSAWKKLLESPDRATMFLSHPDSQLRLAAAYALANCWKLAESQLGLLDHTSLEDPDPGVRGMALYALVRGYVGTNNPRILKKLALIVRDESFSDDFRLGAYLGLFEICAPCTSKRPNEKLAQNQFIFPKDVDWAYVSTFS